MAYLTEYSYSQLINRIGIDNVEFIDKQFFIKNIFDNEYLFYFYNQLDLKKLYAEKVLLSGKDRGILVYQKVPTREDDFTYIFAMEGKVKYHKNSECEALKSGFTNFFIPEPVARLEKINEDKHKKIVTEIRKWFKMRHYTIKKYKNGDITDSEMTNDFNAIFPEKFGIDRIVVSSSEKGQFKWFVEKKTTGINQTEESFNYNNFLSEINDLLNARQYLCNSKSLRKLSKYDFLIKKDDREIIDYITNSIEKDFLKDVSPSFIKNYGLNKLKLFWQSHLDLKNKSKKFLSNYFKWTYNYNNSTFDEIFLNDYNLEACKLCYDNS